MIIGLIIMLLVLFVIIGSIMNEILEKVDVKIYRDTKVNLFSIVFCSNLFGILSVILLSLI